MQVLWLHHSMLTFILVWLQPVSSGQTSKLLSSSSRKETTSFKSEYSAQQPIKFEMFKHFSVLQSLQTLSFRYFTFKQYRDDAAWVLSLSQKQEWKPLNETWTFKCCIVWYLHTMQHNFKSWSSLIKSNKKKKQRAWDLSLSHNTPHTLWGRGIPELKKRKKGSCESFWNLIKTRNRLPPIGKACTHANHFSVWLIGNFKPADRDL